MGGRSLTKARHPYPRKACRTGGLCPLCHAGIPRATSALTAQNGRRIESLNRAWHPCRGAGRPDGRPKRRSGFLLTPGDAGHASQQPSGSPARRRAGGFAARRRADRPARGPAARLGRLLARTWPPHPAAPPGCKKHGDPPAGIGTGRTGLFSRPAIPPRAPRMGHLGFMRSMRTAASRASTARASLLSFFSSAECVATLASYCSRSLVSRALC